MIKQIVLALLLTTSLAFGKLGDTRETLEQFYGQPAKEQVYSKRTVLERYYDPDGETISIVVYYDGKSVAETYYSKYNRGFSTDFIMSIVMAYGDQWIPFLVSDQDCRCIKTANTGFYRICSGPLIGTNVLHALTIVCLDAEAALKDMGEDTPYKKSSGLRL